MTATHVGIAGVIHLCTPGLAPVMVFLGLDALLRPFVLITSLYKRKAKSVSEDKLWIRQLNTNILNEPSDTIMRLVAVLKKWRGVGLSLREDGVMLQFPRPFESFPVGDSVQVGMSDSNPLHIVDIARRHGQERSLQNVDRLGQNAEGWTTIAWDKRTSRL